VRDIDQITRLILNACPTVRVRQLSVSHPGADDDGIWFFNRPDSEFEVQAESPNGMCPFLIETDKSDTRVTANCIEEAVAIIANLLRMGPLGAIRSR
jgi:hypothetical protein